MPHKNCTIIPVILSGGSGSRLWPLTRNDQPKQFLKLLNNHSLLQNTLDRVLTCTDTPASQVITVTNDAYIPQTLAQYRDFEPEAMKHIIGEPMARNTAPAIAYAVLHARHHFGEDAILWIVPADHYIGHLHALQNSLTHAVDAAQKGHIATFGITPTSPSTEYGYIQINPSEEATPYCRIQSFVEKPNEETAQHYIESREYYWNSGMFVATAQTLLSEFDALAPEIITPITTYFSNHKTGTPISPHVYDDLPDIPFDIAIMEKTSRAVVVPCDNMEWSDVGTWGSLWELKDKERDRAGNLIDGHVASINTQDCLIHANSMLVATIGLRDLVIIEDGDSILIADKKENSAFKKLSESLKRTQHPLTKNERFIKKPWGRIKTLSREPEHCVRELQIDAEKQTSLHAHRHRCEFWTIVEGQATVTLNGETLCLKEQDTLFIPINARHRIHNDGQRPLKIIEVQCGKQLDEDDILRFSDSYGRQVA